MTMIIEGLVSSWPTFCLIGGLGALVAVENYYANH